MIILLQFKNTKKVKRKHLTNEKLRYFDNFSKEKHLFFNYKKLIELNSLDLYILWLAFRVYFIALRSKE